VQHSCYNNSFSSILSHDVCDVLEILKKFWNYEYMNTVAIICYILNVFKKTNLTPYYTKRYSLEILNIIQNLSNLCIPPNWK